MMAASPSELVLIYDGDCPVCSSYVRYVRLKAAAGKLTLVNARDGGEWVNKAVAAGLSLDEGMALHYGGRFYHGADCIHMLALLSTPSGVFNRINSRLFSSPHLARVLYPVLRAGRNSLLRMLNRSQLNLTHGD